MLNGKIVYKQKNESPITILRYFVTASDLGNDLAEIITWVFQWKMNFDLDPTKQVKELFFKSETSKYKSPMFDFRS